MKTLFLSHAAALGGAELYLLDYFTHNRIHNRMHNRQEANVVLFAEGAFAERLRAVGAKVEVLAAPSTLLGVVREARGHPGVAVATGVLELARRVARKAGAFELLVANSQKAFVVGALAALIARRPLVWCLHDILSAEHFSAANRKLVVALANLTGALVVANSQATADAFVKSGGRAARVRVVYNGIDVGAFDEAQSAPALGALRRELGIGDAPLVGVFSRLSAWKGQHVLLAALTELPGTHAVLVGDALFGEDAYAQKLRVQAQKLGISERVHFLGFRRDIPELMAQVDIVAHTSTAAEPFGRVIVEGMLARRPVVATRGGAVSEIVRDGATGLIVEPDDEAGLAAAIRELTSAPAQAAALGAAGRRTAADRFSLLVMAAGLTRCFAEVGTRGGSLEDYEPQVIT